MRRLAILPAGIGGLIVVAAVNGRPRGDLRRDLGRTILAVIVAADLMFLFLFRGELWLVAMVNVVAPPLLHLAWRKVARTAELVRTAEAAV